MESRERTAFAIGAENDLHRQVGRKFPVVGRDDVPKPGASPARKQASTSPVVSPAYRGAPTATSACACTFDLRELFRSGCSYAPTMYALPRMLTLTSLDEGTLRFASLT